MHDTDIKAEIENLELNTKSKEFISSAGHLINVAREIFACEI